MPDQELTIGVNILNLEELKELREELERIKELKKEIEELQEENTEPGIPLDIPDIDPHPEPEHERRFWVKGSEEDVNEFDPFENDEDFKAETSFEI